MAPVTVGFNQVQSPSRIVMDVLRNTELLYLSRFRGKKPLKKKEIEVEELKRASVDYM